jgi:superfamily II DNA or RNA helicase
MAVGLYKHNAYAYEQIEEKLKTSNRTCVIHPTGSGKSFIAIKWLYENRNKKCLFLTSQKPIIDQIIRHIESCGLTLNDFPYLKFDLYQNITEQIATTYSTDCIVLDEFHRCGAPKWGKGLDVLLNNNSNAKVLGFSATPIRYLDDCRNMAEELFDNNIASQITLVEAVTKGILPLPTYINALYSFDEDIQRIQTKINKLASESDRKLFQEKFDSAKKLLEKSEGLEKVFSKNITKSNGRFIVFCRDVEHMNRMIEESKNWFGSVNSNIDMYSVISTNKDFDNRNSIESFETSNNDHLKLLFCVNMLNEGLHVNDIDGVIMLRPTISPIIYLQQLGRALSVGHNEHPLIFDIVNNSLGIKDIDKFYEQVKRQIQTGTNNPAISGYKDIDIGSFKVIDEMSSMIDLFDIIDKSLTKETYDNSKAKKLYDDLIELGHQPNRNNSKEESSLYTALISHGREWLTEEQLDILKQMEIYIPEKLSQEDLSAILFEELMELGHQPSQAIPEESNLYSRLVQRGAKYLTEDQLQELSNYGIYIPKAMTQDERGNQLFNELVQFGHQPSQAIPEESNLYSRLVQRGAKYLTEDQLQELSNYGIYIPKAMTQDERGNQLFNELVQFGHQPARASKDKVEVNLYGRLQRHGREWLTEEQLQELSKLGIKLPETKGESRESEEFFNELMLLGHQPKKSNPEETSLYRKLQRRGSTLLTPEQRERLSQLGIAVPVRLEQSDYIEQAFCSLINLGHYPSASVKEEHALYVRVYKYKDKFSEEQKQILSYLGFIPETEVVDINHITQYVLARLNQATEKGNAEMINNYQNILGIINQKNNGLNGAENNPHHLK